MQCVYVRVILWWRFIDSGIWTDCLPSMRREEGLQYHQQTIWTPIYLALFCNTLCCWMKSIYMIVGIWEAQLYSRKKGIEEHFECYGQVDSQRGYCVSRMAPESTCPVTVLRVEMSLSLVYLRELRKQYHISSSSSFPSHWMLLYSCKKVNYSPTFASYYY